MAAAGELRCRCVDRDVLEDRQRIHFERGTEKNAIKAFVDRKYVFAVLPTGFGKSLIYQLTTLLYPIERRGIIFPGSVATRPIITAQWSSIRLIF